mmetsp:Transcript_24604/g.41731  ORF Transcript_24604/g.41731 Transcript_24604/m.41731 type:complete len:287 (-) Transcript_24604:173-1033(-)
MKVASHNPDQKHHVHFPSALPAIHGFAKEGYSPPVHGGGGLVSKGPGKDEPVFLHLGEDLASLALSSWFVPDVKQKWRGQVEFWIVSIVQFTMLYYLSISIEDKYDEGADYCGAKPMMQVVTVFICGTGALNGLNAHNALQVALTATHIVVATTGAKVAVRPTPSWARALMCSIAIVDFVKDMLVFILGLNYVLIAGSTEGAFMNSLAVAFISEVDELMFSTYVNKATKVRMGKYLYPHIIGIPDGQTNLQQASANTKKVVWLEKWFPLLWGVIAICGVVISRSTC